MSIIVCEDETVDESLLMFPLEALLLCIRTKWLEHEYLLADASIFS